LPGRIWRRKGWLGTSIATAVPKGAGDTASLRRQDRWEGVWVGADAQHAQPGANR